tara:strand:- start:1017 stop:1238 length:222 start_codon:yes stop_codon:yes gene_type:complete
MYKLLNKITGLLALIFVISFLVGITLTLDKSRYISFLDTLPVWIIMITVIFMLILDFYNSTKQEIEDKDKDKK